jgi:hypothetical protein
MGMHRVAFHAGPPSFAHGAHFSPRGQSCAMVSHSCATPPPASLIVMKSDGGLPLVVPIGSGIAAPLVVRSAVEEPVAGSGSEVAHDASLLELLASLGCCNAGPQPATSRSAYDARMRQF